MATSSITPGASAPPFTLQALGSGRSVSQIGGAPLLLVFHDQNTVDKVQAMQQAVRTEYSDARDLQVASVVNMKAVPVFLRSTAESVMKGSYAKAAAAMPPGLDAADYVVILLDWDGKVSHAYGAQRIERRPRLVLIDQTGAVSGVHQGEEIEQAALAMITDLLGPSAAAQAPAPEAPAPQD
jgi:hypothetical protein